jgi:N-acetylmuramoyl-L-alanine amidase
VKIKNGRVDGVEFVEANAYDRNREMKPTLIVLHDTAGQLDPKSSVKWFASDECPNSAHIVIERDGTITQCVPFNRRAYHCGISTFDGRANCNDYAIGIELVNPGILDKDGRAWFHKTNPKKPTRGYNKAGLEYAETKYHGKGWWMPYTQEQIAAVTNLCKAICGAYEITDITTHWFIRWPLKLPIHYSRWTRCAALP